MKKKVVQKKKLSNERIYLIKKRIQNPSLKREAIVRSVLLPLSKKTFGPNLKSVVLLGSSQLKIRKASEKRNSDLELRLVVDMPLNEMFRLHDLLLKKLNEQVQLDAGFKIHLWVSSPKKFFRNELKSNDPFQIIYGQNYLKKLFGKDFEKISSRVGRNKEKYD